MSNPGAEGVKLTLELLRRFPEAPLNVEVRESSIKISPSLHDSFPLMVYDEGAETMVAADRWHTHYDDPQQVAFCVWWLLTPFYRLVHETKGGSLVAAWIERYEATGWEGFEPVYFLNPDHDESWILAPGEHFQRRYVQQAVLPPPADYSKVEPGARLDEAGLPPHWQHGVWTVTAESAVGPSLAR